MPSPKPEKTDRRKQNPGRPTVNSEPTKVIRVPESLAEPIKQNLDKIREFLSITNDA